MTPTPRGTVTFLFSDVEGSTRLLETHPEIAGSALARHHELLAAAISEHSGVIFETVGDAIYAAFQRAPNAARAALASQWALAKNDWGPIPKLRVRIAIHTGEVESRGAHYFGAPLFRCARLQSLAYGDQTLLSETAATLVSGDLPPRSSVADLGWQRLKDLDEPEHVFQLDSEGLPSAFPPLRSPGETKHNLPAEFSSFIGREASLDSLRERIAKPGVVVIVGPGGVGKTRLAVHLAHESRDAFPDGSYFVELASLSQAAECIPAVALALHLRETPGRSIEDVVKAFLTDRRMLIILDNAEHLPGIAEQVRELAESARDASILVTSRGKLALPGAQHEQLHPMQAEAVELLAERVRSLDPLAELGSEQAPLLARICARVDGLPLGLELVAPVVATIGLNETLTSLDRRRPIPTDAVADRHTSLRATVAWSYGLLDANARDVFAQLSVFEGSFTLDAAVAVCRSSAERTERGLLALAGNSLVSPAEGAADERRFSMLVTVHEFARDALQAAESTETGRRHAIYFASLASGAEGLLRGPSQAVWRDRLTLELPDLRAALGWTERHAPADLLRFAVDLAHLWDYSGLYTEGRGWLSRALHQPGGDPSTRARALRWLGIMAEHQGDMTSAARTYRKLSALQRRQGDASGLADTKRGIAGIASPRGRQEKRRRLLEEALDQHHKDGDKRLTAEGLNQLTLLELESGNPDSALTNAREMEGLYRELGDTTGVAAAIHHRARALRQSGQLAEAKETAEAAISMFQSAGSATWLPFALVNLAWIELALADPRSARVELCRALVLARAHEEWGVVPRILEPMAAVGAVGGDTDLAHRIVRAADHLRSREHWPRNRTDTRELRRYVTGTSRSKPSTPMSDAEAEELIAQLASQCQ